MDPCIGGPTSDRATQGLRPIARPSRSALGRPDTENGLQVVDFAIRNHRFRAPDQDTDFKRLQQASRQAYDYWQDQPDFVSHDLVWQSSVGL